MSFDIRDALAFLGAMNVVAYAVLFWTSARFYFQSEPLDIDVTVEDDFADEPNMHVVNDQLAEAFGSYRTNIPFDEWSDEEPTTVLEVKKPSQNPPAGGLVYKSPEQLLARMSKGQG